MPRHWPDRPPAGIIGPMTLMFAWTDSPGTPRDSTDRLTALACAMQVTRISMRDATGWTSPSHKTEKTAEKFAEWLAKGSDRDAETRRRILLTATDLATDGAEHDDVLTVAAWMHEFVTGTGK